MYMPCLLQLKEARKRGKGGGGGGGGGGNMTGSFGSHFLVRESLPLSRNTDDPTVGGLRDKKESCSTRRGLRWVPNLGEFPQTPRGRDFSLLGFYSSFKYYVNVSFG